MGKDLDGKVALVTGASRGIGRAIAERLADDGATVVVHFNASRHAAEEVVAGITTRGGSAWATQADVAQSNEVRALYAAVEDEHGGVDIVVNNAAIAVAGLVHEVGEEAFDRLVAVNLKSVFVSAQEIVRVMRDGGRVVNLSTTLPTDHVMYLGAYGATKGGIDILTRALARQLGSRGITVNAVAPGPTDTDMLIPEAREGLPQIIAHTPLGRLGLPGDIADTVAFLASDRARWVTGHTIPVNGGIE
jgi:3-oxoacyl-[acyl-carrier protein] reductase